MAKTRRTPQQLAAWKHEQAKANVARAIKLIARIAKNLPKYNRRVAYYAARAAMTDAAPGSRTHEAPRREGGQRCAPGPTRHRSQEGGRMRGMIVDMASMEATVVYACDSKEHDVPVLATRRLYLVSGATDYCDPCAVWAKKIYESMGGALPYEEILSTPVGIGSLRGIQLDGDI